MTDNKKIHQLEKQLSDCENTHHIDIHLKIDTLNDLAWALSDSDFPRALTLAEQAHALSKSKQKGFDPYLLGVAYSLRTLGYLNTRTGNHPEGLSQLFNAQEIFERLGHLKGMPDVFDGIAGIYSQISNYPVALEYALKQLEAAQQRDDKQLIANANNNIAVINFAAGNYEGVRETLLNNLQISSEIGYKRIESLSHMNLVDIYWIEENYEKALKHGEASLQVNQESGFKLFESYSFKIIGETYRKLGNTTQALHFLKQALDLSKKMENKVFESSILLNLGKVYRAEQRDDLAIEYLHQAIGISLSIEANYELAQGHFILSKIYEGQEDNNQALYHFKEFHSINEVIFNENTDKRLKVLKVAHDTEAVRREVNILKSKTEKLTREVAKRKQIERSLRENESKFRNFVGQSTDGIVLVDEHGLIIEWNRGAEKLTGLKQKDVLDTHMWEVQVQLLPDDRKTPDAPKHFKTLIMKALQTGESPWLNQITENAFQRADGGESFVQQRFFPIKTEAGFMLGAISTDVTKRKQNEEELRKLSRAVEQSGGTIVITDPTGVIEFVNPAFSKITGYPSQEAIGQHTNILKSGFTPVQVYNDMWETITQGGVWEGELHNRKKSGELYWESATISPVKDKAGHITHFIAAKEDITMRKEDESGLQEAHDTMEQRVQERTSELILTNEDLQQEITQRRQAEFETRQLLETLEKRVADRTLELAAFFDLTIMASETRSLDDLLSPAAARIMEAARCDAVSVHLFSEDHATMKLVTHINLPEDSRLLFNEIPLQGRFGRWAESKSKPIVNSKHEQESLLPSAYQILEYPVSLMAQIQAQDQPRGVLICFRRSDEVFALDEISLLNGLADQLGIILENQRLRDYVEEIAISEERQRLARELHDSITQMLFSQVLFSRAAHYAIEDGDQPRLDDNLKQIEENAVNSLREMRLLLFHLQPQALANMTLAEAIETRLDMVERRLEIQAICEVDEFLDIPLEIEETIYHLTMEALNNSLKHAHAAEVRVQLKATETGAILKVSDNGLGFNTNESQGGMGLGNMRERVRQSGGKLEIRSHPGEGTVVQVTI